MTGQLHDQEHTTDNCGQCARDRAEGALTVHYWEPMRDEDKHHAFELARVRAMCEVNG